MRTFDFAPFYRSTVGFDRMFSMLDQLGGVEGSAPSYPPYNIERNGENAFRVSVAVAGARVIHRQRSELAPPGRANQEADSPTLIFRSKRRETR
jgi:hypothetical protein